MQRSSIYQITCPSNDPEKNSVPLLELIHKTELTAPRWQTSNSLMATRLLSARVSQQPTWPDSIPLASVVWSFGLYSKQTIELGGFNVSIGAFGFSGLKKKYLKIRMLSKKKKKHFEMNYQPTSQMKDSLKRLSHFR